MEKRLYLEPEMEVIKLVSEGYLIDTSGLAGGGIGEGGEAGEGGGGATGDPEEDGGW